MEIKNLKTSKFLMGLFFREDYSYETKKGVVINGIRDLLAQNREVDIILNGPIGDLILCKDNIATRVRMTNSTLHFEGEFVKEEFLHLAREIIKIHEEIFQPQLVKLGFITYFKSLISFPSPDSLFPIEPEKPYLQRLVHYNYIQTIKNRPYTANIKILVVEQSILSGEVDFNLTKESSPELSSAMAEDIFNDSYDYYMTEFVSTFLK